MIKIAICDDDRGEREHMSGLIEEYRDVNHIQYEYTVFRNGFELISVLEKGHVFDIYCLDIIMPGFSGISLAKEIRLFDKIAQIIFFTSTPEFALEGYSVQAVNYVLKPVTREILFFTLTEVLERIKQEEGLHIIVKGSEGLQKILLSNLMYVEAMGKKVVFHLMFGGTIECTHQISVVCKELIKAGSFIQPHRSYLVNMSYIDRIGKEGIVLQNGTSVPAAQAKLKEMKRCYLAFQMEEV